jgi:uncharacterized protein
MRVIRAAGNRRMPWKNGGGTTYEIAASPPGCSLEDFDWRISRASVTQPGPFSLFAGIDRNLSVLSGGLTLTTADGTRMDLSSGSLPFDFPGEIGITGTPVDGPVMDFNVMTWRGRYRSSVVRADIDDKVGFDDIVDTILVLVETGRLSIVSDAETLALEPLDCLLLQKPDVAVVQNLDGPAHVIVAELWRV